MVLEAPGAADTAKPAAAAAPDRAAVAPDPDPTPDRAEPAEPAPPEVAPTPITTPPATAGQLSPVPVTPTAPGARRVPHAGAPGAGADGDSDASEDDTPRKVSDVELELRLLALASCQLGPQGIDPKCEAMVQYKAGRTSDRMLAAFNQGARDIGLRHLGNPSPSVRLQALQLVGSLHKASPEFLQPVIDAALREPETYLAVQLLRRLGSSIGRDPKVLELMFTQSRHEVPEVRMEASLWLLSAWARDTEGSLERGLELAEKDPVRRVRRMACRRLGERADERALPLLRKLTDGPGNDPELYAACFTGLVGMWAYPTVHDPPSQKAYELTLKRLQAVPRTKESPPWSALSGLQWSKTEAFRERAP